MRPVSERSKLITARFKGRCRECGRQIAAGEMVYFAKHFGCKCRECGPHRDTDEPLPSRSRGPRSTTGQRWGQDGPKDNPPRETPPRKSPPKRGRKGRKRGGHVHDGQVLDQDPMSHVVEPERTWTFEKGADGIHRYTFESIGENLNAALSDWGNCESARERANRRIAENLTGSDQYANYFTVGRFHQELENPSERIRKAVEEMKDEIIRDVLPPSQARRRIARNQDWGDELSVDRWLQRDPFGWERSTREQQPKRTITIGCNITIGWTREPEDLLYRGAAAAALADILTAKGYSVEVIAFTSTTELTDDGKTHPKAVTRVRVKQSTQPMDVAAMSFCLSEIAFYQMIAVNAFARMCESRPAEGLGHCVNLFENDRQGVDFLIDQDVFSREQAVTWIRNQLTKDDATQRN